MATRKRRTEARAVGDLLAPALRALGMPSTRLTQRILQAWGRTADPSWAAQVHPARLEGGVLFVEVDSSALRQELAQFHAERLLTVMKTALPDVPLVAIRFTAGASSPGRKLEDRQEQGDPL